MSGPPPKKRARRGNQPTLPTRELSPAGPKGAKPKPPSRYKLGAAGTAWWNWAWGLPQALAWDDGAHYALARRASLEDDLEALESSDRIRAELGKELRGAVKAKSALHLTELLRAIDETMRRLKSLAAGRTAVMKEMRELDNRFGLNPKSMAELRWSIEEPEEDEEKPAASQRRRRRAVDPKAKAAATKKRATTKGK